MHASKVFLIRSALVSLTYGIFGTTYALYYIQGLGLTPLQLLLVGTILEVTIMLFEIPTGVVADTYGRRRSVLIGWFIVGLAWLLGGLVPLGVSVIPGFIGIALTEVIRGIGETFLSGAEEAWITDEVGADHVGALLLRAGQIGRVTRLIGIGLSVWLASIHLALPYGVSGGLLLVLALFLFLTMPETAWRRQERPAGQSHLRAMKETFVEGVRAVRVSPVLMLLIATAAIGGAGSEGIDRLWEAHLLATFQLGSVLTVTPAMAFGLLAVASSLLGLVAGRVGEKWLDLNRPRTTTLTLVVTLGLKILFFIGYALAPSLWIALPFLLLHGAVESLFEPTRAAWTNQQIPSRTRATVLSLISQSNALGQTVGGPGVGWVGNRFGLRAALVMAAALFGPALGLYATASRSEGAELADPAATEAESAEA